MAPSRPINRLIQVPGSTSLVLSQASWLPRFMRSSGDVMLTELSSCAVSFPMLGRSVSFSICDVFLWVVILPCISCSCRLCRILVR